MNYDSPELREQLAAEYVLGTMPILVRQRFERLLEGDAALRRTVDNWHLRFDPLDDAAPEAEPPARVWNAIERQLALPPAPSPERSGWLASLAFWRGMTFAAAALAALALVYIAVRPRPAPTTNVVAILSDDKGDPSWIALAAARSGEISVAPIRSISVAPVRSVAGDVAQAFELWVIADGKPRPLGLLTPEPGRPLMVQASLVPPGGVLAISIEPSGGSPTGLPTGPVPYKGAVISNNR
jgi:anti-sigma-K factor RskA